MKKKNKTKIQNKQAIEAKEQVITSEASNKQPRLLEMCNPGQASPRNSHQCFFHIEDSVAGILNSCDRYQSTSPVRLGIIFGGTAPEMDVIGVTISFVHDCPSSSSMMVMTSNLYIV